MTVALETADLPELLPSDATNLAGQTSEELGREYISQSQVSTLLACPQKYGYSYDQGIEPISTPAALSLGKAFQLALEYRDPDVAAHAIFEERPIRDQDEQDRAEIDAAIVTAASRLYLAHYPELEDATPEYEYRVRLRNPWTGRYSNTFDLLGLADELARENDQPVLVENKLVGQINETSVRRLPLDRQVALACYGVWRATGEAVTQVRYRFTRKPSIRQKKGESVGDFCHRIEADYAGRPDFYLREERWWRSPEDLVRIEAELWEWAEIVRASRKRRLWPRNTSHCHDFGGCSYLPLCLGDADAPSLYQEKQSRQHKEDTDGNGNAAT